MLRVIGKARGGDDTEEYASCSVLERCLGRLLKEFRYSGEFFAVAIFLRLLPFFFATSGVVGV